MDPQPATRSLRHSLTAALTRRDFLRRAGWSALLLPTLPLVVSGSTAAPAVPSETPVAATGTTGVVPPPEPAQISGVNLTLVTSNTLVPAATGALRDLAGEWARLRESSVTITTATPTALTARLAALATGPGDDILQCQDHWVRTHAESFVPLSAEAEYLAARGNGYYDAPVALARVDGVWRALPWALAPSAVIYRTDQFAAAGAATFPATTDALLATGTQLKAAGHPFGAPAGRSPEDPSTLWYALLWAFGGRTVEADGRTIAINRPETRAALDWAAHFWRAACADDGLLWDDNSNNRLYVGGDLSATLNGPAIYLQARQMVPALADVSNHAPFPAGPAGQGVPITSYAHAIPRASANQAAARDLLLWLALPAQTDRFLIAAGGTLAGPLRASENSPVWASVPVMAGFLASAKNGRWIGWPGPPTRAAANSAANFVLVDLFARVVAGEAPARPLADAEAAFKSLYS